MFGPQKQKPHAPPAGFAKQNPAGTAIR